MIIKVSRHTRKAQQRQTSAPRSVKVLKPKTSQEETPVETAPQPSLIVRQVRNVRPLTPAAALFAWNSLFQTGVA